MGIEQQNFVDLSSSQTVGGDKTFTGALGFPNISQFQTYQDTAHPVEATTFKKIQFLFELEDKLGEVANSRFTARNTGKYLFAGCFHFIVPAPAPTNWRIRSSVFVNGASFKAILDTTLNGAVITSVPFNLVTQLNAGDYLEIFGWSAVACNTVAGQFYTYFEGLRLA